MRGDGGNSTSEIVTAEFSSSAETAISAKTITDSHGALRSGTFFSSKEPIAKPTLGRSSGFRFELLAAPSHGVLQSSAVAICSFRHRLQRRDRNGFAPFSLFFRRNDKSPRTPKSIGSY